MTSPCDEFTVIFILFCYKKKSSKLATGFSTVTISPCDEFTGSKNIYMYCLKKKVLLLVLVLTKFDLQSYLSSKNQKGKNFICLKTAIFLVLLLAYLYQKIYISDHCHDIVLKLSVTGPLVYGICFSPVADKEKFKEMGFAGNHVFYFIYFFFFK